MVTKAIWVIMSLSHYYQICLECVTKHEVGVAYEEERGDVSSRDMS